MGTIVEITACSNSGRVLEVRCVDVCDPPSEGACAAPEVRAVLVELSVQWPWAVVTAKEVL